MAPGYSKLWLTPARTGVPNSLHAEGRIILMVPAEIRKWCVIKLMTAKNKHVILMEEFISNK